MELNGVQKEGRFMQPSMNSNFESGGGNFSSLTRDNEGLGNLNPTKAKAQELVAGLGGAVQGAEYVGSGPSGATMGLGISGPALGLTSIGPSVGSVVQLASPGVLKASGLSRSGLLTPIVEGLSTSPSGPSVSRSYAAAVHPQVAQATPLKSQPSSLHYTQPLVENGRVKVVPPIAVAVEGCAAWRSTLVGYFVGKSLPFAVVNSIAHKIWDKMGLMDVLSTESGFYLFRFESTPQAEQVLHRVPWHMASIPLALKLWEPNLTLSLLGRWINSRYG